MKRFKEFVTEQDEALFEMANLVTRDTGLPFVVWISPRMGARHDVRIKVSQNPKMRSSELVSVAIRPAIRVIDGEIDAKNMALLRKWIELNRDTIGMVKLKQPKMLLLPSNQYQEPYDRS